MAKIVEYRDLSVDELNEKVASLKKELMQYRFQHKTGKLEKQSTLKETKKSIARVKTVINEKKKGEKKA